MEDAIDHALCVPPQITDAGFSAQIFVHRFFDIRFSFHVSLVKREFPCLLLVDIVRRTDVTKKMCTKCAVDVGADRLDGDIHAWQPYVVLRKFGHRGEIDVLDIGKGNFGVVAIVFLQPAGVVIACKIELVEARDDTIIYDLDNVRLFLIFRHSIDNRSIFGQGR